MEKIKTDIQLFADAASVINATSGYVDGATGAVTQFSGTNTLSPEMKTFYDTELLENARSELFHTQFAKKQPLPAHRGKTVEWRKWNTLPNASTLQEGVIPTGEKLGMTYLDSTISQFGIYVTVSDQLEMHAVDDAILGATEELGASAGATADRLARNTIAACPIKIFAPKSNGTKVTGRASLSDDCKMTADLVNKAVTALKKLKAPKINGKYVAIIHPSVAYDLRSCDQWIDAHKYAAAEEIFNGEIGELHGCRFVETTEAKVWRGEDLASDSRTLSVNAAASNSRTVNFDGGTAPAEPQDGQAWLDTSESTHVLKQYSSTMGMWVQVSSTYVKIAATDIGRGFKEGDGVEILGLSYIGDEGVKRQIEALNGSQIVYGAGEGCVIIAGILDQAVTVSGPVKIRRTVPDMDFVIESQNRLWGCKYGPVSDRDVLGNITDTYTVNELYCCKLGDFKNWRVYSGIATDAWSASLGSDGVFTGAAVYQGYPIFFKEDCLHKVYISPTGAHQVVTTQCRGVQRGSAKSLAVVNELLYYKSPTDVCSYDGTVPVSVSAALGDERYSGAVSGSARGKYFISMDDEEGESRFFCYDTRKGLWYRWGSVGAKAFARAGDELYFYDGDNVLRSVFGTVGTPETSVSWSAETGLIGYEYPDKKYLSRYNFRMGLPKGSEMKLYVMYDSSGSWIPAGGLSGTGTGTFTLPVRPRRCDHMRFKLTGTGEIKLYSITRILEQGSDV